MQAYSDLPGIYRDKRYFDKIVNRFGFTSDQQLSLLEPRIKHCNNMTSELGRLFKSNPHETIFALFCYSSHGMIQDGRQVILVNEHNKAKGFYKFFGAE